MELISNCLVDCFIKENIISAEQKETYKIGIELIIADIINFSAILLIGVLIKRIQCSGIYIFLLMYVRRFCGGFHAKTYWVCRMVTIGTYITILFVSNIILRNTVFYVILFDAISILTMVLFAPIAHPNKRLTYTEKRANKFFSIVSTSIFSTISIFMYVFGLKEGIFTSTTLLSIAILMYVGLLKNIVTERRENRCVG